MGEIIIYWAEGYSDCDDCGPYSWYKMKVELDGVLIDEEYGDGHLSGGYSDPLEFRTGYVRAFTSLGHVVEIVDQSKEILT